MKKITITFLALFIGAYGLFSQANWEWTMQESGTTESLRDVFFINNTTGWVVGSNGIILKTADGGNTWVAQSSGTTQELSTVYFINENIGWATGGSLSSEQAPLLKTSDGGDTWTLYAYSFSGHFVRDLFFVDANNGWVIKSDSIYKSADGGVSWTHDRFASTVEGPLDNQAIFAVSDSVAFIAGRSKRSGTSKTATAFDRRFPVSAPPFWGTDGSNQFTNSETLRCLTFSNDSVGFIGGSEGRLYRMQITDPVMTNGPWNLIHDLEESKTLWSISFGNSETGMFNTSTDIEGETIALVYHTEDQGETWTAVPDSVPGMLLATLHSPDNQNAWMVASAGKIYKGTPDYSSIFEKRPEINLQVFPNPTTGLVTIYNPDKYNKLTISVINLTGQFISEFLIENSDKVEINIDGNPGIYFVKAINEKGGQRVIKVIKE